MNATEAFARLLAKTSSLSFWMAFLDTFPDAEVYLVGGAVRDTLLGRETADFDFVVQGVSRPRLQTWFHKLRGTFDLTGRRFGVYKFQPKGRTGVPPFDIALPRTEVATTESLGGYRDFDVQSDPHLPIESDLSRRDLTVNAMAYALRSRTLHDPFHGQEDLRERTLRAVRNPSERFREDLTRVLRVLRFSIELDFSIEPSTWEALMTCLPHINRERTNVDGKQERVIAREAIGNELRKMLTANAPAALALLERAEAFAYVFPPGITPQYVQHANKPLPVSVALLFSAVKREETRSAVHAMGLPAEDIFWIQDRLQEPAEDPETLRAHQFEKRYLGARGTWLIDALESVGKTEVARAAQSRAARIRARWRVQEQEKIASLIDGRDLLALGLEPGPRVRIILDQLRDEQLDGTLLDRATAQERARELVTKT